MKKMVRLLVWCIYANISSHHYNSIHSYKYTKRVLSYSGTVVTNTPWPLYDSPMNRNSSDAFGFHISIFYAAELTAFRRKPGILKLIPSAPQRNIPTLLRYYLKAVMARMGDYILPMECWLVDPKRYGDNRFIDIFQSLLSLLVCGCTDYRCANPIHGILHHFQEICLELVLKSPGVLTPPLHLLLAFNAFALQTLSLRCLWIGGANIDHAGTSRKLSCFSLSHCRNIRCVTVNGGSITYADISNGCSSQKVTLALSTP